MEIFNNKPFKNLATTLLALLVIFVAVKIVSDWKSMKYIGSNISATNVISVSGKGEMLATPDIATFSFTVSQEAAAVPEAQTKTTTKTNAILAYLKQVGIEDRDIKTSSYNIYPRYDYVTTSINVGGKQVLAAYVVSQSVVVKVRKLDQAGTVLSGIGGLGATDVSGLSFSVDNQDILVRQARDKAIGDARDQAQVLAGSLGVTLGRIVSYSESGQNNPYPVYYAKDSMMSAGASAPTPQIPAGENKITSNVSITYEIK